MKKPNFEVGAVHWRSPMVFTHRMKNSMLLGKHSRHCCQTDFWLLQALRLPHRTCHSTHQLGVGHPWLKCPVLIISNIWFVLLPEARDETHVRRTYVLQANIFQKWWIQPWAWLQHILTSLTQNFMILPRESNSSTIHEFMNLLSWNTVSSRIPICPVSDLLINKNVNSLVSYIPGTCPDVTWEHCWGTWNLMAHWPWPWPFTVSHSKNSKINMELMRRNETCPSPFFNEVG